MFYNDIQIQSLDGKDRDSCGWYSIYIADQLLKGRKLKDIILNDFNIEHKNNYRILDKFFDLIKQ